MSKSQKSSPLSLKALRRSAATIVACAVQDLYPDVQLVGGEGTDIGFYYDFIFKKPPDDALMPQLEERLRALVTANYPIRSLTMVPKNGAELFKHHGQHFKAQEALQAESQFLEIFHMQDFYDICPTPYITSSKEIAAIKLLEIISEHPRYSKMGDFVVTRVLGTAFFYKDALKQFVKQIKVAKTQDHRLVGSAIFCSFDDVSFGNTFWQPAGMELRDKILDWWKKEHKEQKFKFISTPKIVSRIFIQQEGWMDGEEWPMSIPVDLEGDNDVLVVHPFPLHLLLFQKGGFSSTQLPVRYAEWWETFRDVAPGQLYGMLRTRSFSGDHAHIFCSPEKVLEELISSLHFIERMSKMFNLKPKWILRSRLPQRKKRVESAKKALNWLTLALEKCRLEYELDSSEEKSHFPKIEMCLCDALGQEWTVSTLWVDTLDSSTVIGRTIFGSIERFVALLLEIHGNKAFQISDTI